MKYLICFTLLLNIICLKAETRRLYITELTVAQKKAKGKHWDVFKGAPDIRVVIKVFRANKWQNLFTSPVNKNLHHLIHPINTGVDLAIGEKLMVVVEDKDVAKNDPVGVYVITLTKEAAKIEKQQKVNFGYISSFTYIFSRYKTLMERERRLKLSKMPRQIELHLLSSWNNKAIVGKISINNVLWDLSQRFKPGKYKIKAEAFGHQSKELSMTIPPGENLYQYNISLQPQKRKIELYVICDFPPNEKINPKVAMLGTLDMRKNSFSPGTYNLLIQHPSYLPIKEEIAINPDTKPFLMQRLIKAAPRPITTHINYDVVPQKKVAPKISFSSVDNLKAQKYLASTIKPGRYLFRISQPGYKNATQKVTIWPGTKVFPLKLMLTAKPVELRFFARFDIRVSRKDRNPKFAVIDKTGNACYLVPGKKIKPGKYKLYIYQRGYNFQGPRYINIPPKKKAFVFYGQLLKNNLEMTSPNKRRLIFYIEDKKRNLLVAPTKIINRETKAKVNFKTYFTMGQEVKLNLTFEKYKAVDMDVKIEKQEGPQLVSIAVHRK